MKKIVGDRVNIEHLDLAEMQEQYGIPVPTLPEAIAYPTQYAKAVRGIAALIHGHYQLNPATSRHYGTFSVVIYPNDMPDDPHTAAVFFVGDGSVSQGDFAEITENAIRGANEDLEALGSHFRVPEDMLAGEAAPSS